MIVFVKTVSAALYKSELFSFSYSFNGAICKVYKIDFDAVSKTIYYYTGQSDIADELL